MQFSFYKYEGTGNDFILIEDQKRHFPILERSIKQLCDRRYGVGADGLILIRSENQFDFYNADGSQAEMCGNGLRCFMRFLVDQGFPGGRHTIYVWNKPYDVAVDDNEIVINMGQPKILEADQMLEGLNYYAIECGVPHFVHFCQSLDHPDFLKIAKQIRNHSHFSPLGVNINFVTLSTLKHLKMRTYERGVEAETFSCGTGATAACIAAWKKFGISGRIIVDFLSKEQLQFDLITSDNALKRIEMRGRAKHVFQGTLDEIHFGI